LPFDLESAVSAGLVITMASLVSLPFIANRTSYLDMLFSVLDRMIDHGNLIALDKKRKIHQLETLCANLKTSPSSSPINASNPWQLQSSNLPNTNLASRLPSDRWNPYLGQGNQVEGSRETCEEEAPDADHWANNISPSHLLEAANMLDGGNVLDWVDLPSSSFLFGTIGGE
jgi:hypothetical protein